MNRKIILIFFLSLLLLPAKAIKRSKRTLLQRVHTYAMTLDTTTIDTVSYGYAKNSIRVEKRNPFLKFVPSAYVISHGKQREFITETYEKITFHRYNDYEIKPIIRLTTIPHRRKTMENLAQYLTPTIYSETIVGKTLLSPFHPHNFRFYTYHLTVLKGDTVEVRFKGKRKNTRLVRGSAIIDRLTGRIIRCNYRGEYDMISCWVSMTMNERGASSLFPKDCEGLFRFKFVGNSVSAYSKAKFGLTQPVTDSVTSENLPFIMAKVRPDSLVDFEQDIYRQKLTDDANKALKASLDTMPHKKNWAKEILWDAIGDNVLNRFRTRFGENNQGYVRVNPMLNPLYMGYSGRRGFTYKFDIRASYQIDDQREISGRMKAGYSFKQEQFYFRLPIYYYMSRRKNRYFKFEIGNGNRIKNHIISQNMTLYTPEHGNMGLLSPDTFNEFKQGDGRFILNFDINSKFGFQVGVLQQWWHAVNPYAFRIFGWESHYSSFAPVLELQYRPIGWSGPILTLDYDRGIKGVLKSNTEYERYEFNAEYIHHINSLQSLQMRLGGGMYTNRGRNAYFLNYENFQEDNIPGGWNDDWSGEFELLRRETYNTSSYYVRGNLTYESPLLILSWLPFVGHYMEMERIYISILNATDLHPYTEVGYGFTTRFLSMGLFVSNGQGNRQVGVKFGFELFRHW